METNLPKLIPAPQSLTLTGGTCRLTGFSSILFSGSEDAAPALLRGRFPQASFSVDSRGFTAVIGAELPAAELPDRPDAYVLTAAESGIRIDSVSAAGLFYGVCTLMQFPDEVPCMTVTDYAVIPLRMIHWDLKGYLPKFSVLLDEMRILASYKINSVLLEIEDKYIYKCAPDIAVPGAYTYAQFRELSRTAAALHIRIVPKLQSIAHVDYILKHEKYRSLRENGHVFQYCPSNPDVKALWEAMCTELTDVFREHKGLFHIGADEPGNLGECPECAKLGAAGAYAKRVGESLDFVRAQGWTPVMWDDIVRNSNGLFTPAEEKELLTGLCRGAVLMYWNYGYGGKNNVFPYIDKFRASGLRVFGASGYAGCDNWAGSIPPLAYRGLNIDAWTKAAMENGLECVCATGWTRIGSADCPAEPQESCWATILYAANSMWNGRPRDYGLFLADLFPLFYGCEAEPALADTLMRIAAHPYDFAHALQDAKETDAPRMRFLRISAALESLAGQRTRLLNYMQYYNAKLGRAMEDYRMSLLCRYSKELKDNLAAWKSAAAEVLALYYEPVTADEIIVTRFGYLEKLAAEFSALVDRTELL